MGFTTMSYSAFTAMLDRSALLEVQVLYPTGLPVFKYSFAYCMSNYQAVHEVGAEWVEISRS